MSYVKCEYHVFSCLENSVFFYILSDPLRNNFQLFAFCKDHPIHSWGFNRISREEYLSFEILSS